LEDCRALADRLGWEVVQTYPDNDLSAFNGKTRPGFETMLTAMKAGEFDALICWHPDRLYRTLKDLVRLLDAVSGVEIRTVNGGNLDLSTASGKMLATILGSVAFNESEHKAERQRRAAQQKAKRGLPQWTRAFGYLPGVNGPTLDPQTAPLVREAYAAILAGASLNDICRLWNDAGALTVNGKKWTPPQVSAFLRKPRNAGLRTYNAGRRASRSDVVGPGAWPPLVDESTFWAAAAVMDAPGRAPGRKSLRRHLLTGVLLCGKEGCGGYLSGMETLDKRITYACKQCRGVSIRAEHVEPLIYSVISGRLAMPDAVDLLKAELHDEAEAEALRIEANTLLGELDNIGVERGEGLLTGRQAKIATDRINEKLAAVQRRQQDQERLRVFDGIPLGKPEAADAVARLSPDRLRTVLDVLMTVTVAPVGKGGKQFHPERVQVNW
jgi:DNA invertase Pin-like site-specific DNA recombinase